MPPFTPLPPTSTPKPRRGEPPSVDAGVELSVIERSSASGRQVRRQPHPSASPRAMCCDEGVTVDHDPEHLRTLAEQLAEEAAAFVRRRRTEVFGAGSPPDAAAATRTKSTPTDPVTIVDTETERLLRERLAELRPDDPI